MPERDTFNTSFFDFIEVSFPYKKGAVISSEKTTPS
jgi:hypothetical protein